MEFMYFILLCVIVILIITTKSSLAEKITRLEYRIFEIQEFLKYNTGQQNSPQSEQAPFTESPPPGWIPDPVLPSDPDINPPAAGWAPESVEPLKHDISPPPYKSLKDLIPEPRQEFTPGPVKTESPEPLASESDAPSERENDVPAEQENDTPSEQENDIPAEQENLLKPADYVYGTSSPEISATDSAEQSEQQAAAEPEFSIFKESPDLEKYIGENLINKIGIAILVLAIGYFVKFAIDSNWIGPAGRVGIGILCGGILVGIAHWLRNSYKAFSSVLVGGGIAVFYFTVTLGYHEFHLFDQTVSFVLLALITCFTVALSLLYNRQELAVIALVGGLVSPLMVGGNYDDITSFLSYLVILNTGLLVIAYWKSWRILNISSFVLTAIMFSIMSSVVETAHYAATFWYATILYLLFFGINVANNVKENKKFIGSDFIIVLLNTALYFGAGLQLLTGMHHEDLRGIFTICLAVINLFLTFVMFKSKKVDKNILYLLIGITLTFISLAGPIQLHGHYITIFWATETVLLYWLYKKSGIFLMQLTAQVIWVATLASLLLDWSNVYANPSVSIAIMTNKGFITTLFVAISTYVFYLLYRKTPVKDGVEDGTEAQTDTLGLNFDGYLLNEIFLKYASIVLLFISGLLEINHQISNRFPHTDLNMMYIILYISAFVSIYYTLSKRIESIRLAPIVSSTMICICIVFYLLLMSGVFNIQYLILAEHTISSGHFIAHWATALIIGWLFWQLIIFARTSLPESREIITWVITAVIVFFLSLEICLISNALFYSATNSINDIQNIYIKAGLPVLWGLLSFAIMWIGMRYKYVTLRIISLSLFSVTLVKLFLFDISNIPPAGKIAAFFFLGVLLLIISFMYQKLKKIIASDESNKEE